MIAFRPSARLLKLIGEELISDDVVAVSEFVKNAHDADALTVTLTFRGVTASGVEIEVHARLKRRGPWSPQTTGRHSPS